MVQILDRAPTGAERFLGGLQQSLPAISDLIMQHEKQKNLNKIIGPLMERGQDGSMGSGKGPTWETLLTLASSGHKDIADVLAPYVASQAKQQQEMATEERQKVAQQEELRPSIERLEELIPRTGMRLPFTKSFFGNVPGTQAFEERKEFDTLGFLVADKVYTHFNKGTVSEAKLEQIKQNLAPRADLSERENAGRINAIKKIMNLPPDISKKNFDKVVDQELKKVGVQADKKSEKRKSLDEIFK